MDGNRELHRLIDAESTSPAELLELARNGPTPVYGLMPRQLSEKTPFVRPRWPRMRTISMRRICGTVPKQYVLQTYYIGLRKLLQTKEIRHSLGSIWRTQQHWSKRCSCCTIRIRKSALLWDSTGVGTKTIRVNEHVGKRHSMEEMYLPD